MKTTICIITIFCLLSAFQSRGAKKYRKAHKRLTIHQTAPSGGMGGSAISRPSGGMSAAPSVSSTPISSSSAGLSGTPRPTMHNLSSGSKSFLSNSSPSSSSIVRGESRPSFEGRGAILARGPLVGGYGYGYGYGYPGVYGGYYGSGLYSSVFDNDSYYDSSIYSNGPSCSNICSEALPCDGDILVQKGVNGKLKCVCGSKTLVKKRFCVTANDICQRVLSNESCLAYSKKRRFSK